MVILLVGLEMFVELIDLFCQHSDLDRCGTGVLRVGLKTVDNFCFLFLNYSQLTASLLSLLPYGGEALYCAYTLFYL